MAQCVCTRLFFLPTPKKRVLRMRLQNNPPTPYTHQYSYSSIEQSALTFEIGHFKDIGSSFTGSCMWTRHMALLMLCGGPGIVEWTNPHYYTLYPCGLVSWRRKPIIWESLLGKQVCSTNMHVNVLTPHLLCLSGKIHSIVCCSSTTAWSCGTCTKSYEF